MLSNVQAIKGSSRFRLRGLQNEELLEKMFETLRNTGDDHWSASSGVAPVQSDRSRESSPFTFGDEEVNDDISDPEDMTPTSSAKRRDGSGPENSKGKKPKTTKGNWIIQEIGKMVQLNERATVSCETLANTVSQRVQSGCSIQEVMALVRDCGATPGTNEHFVATTLFTKKPEREMFMTLQTPQERFEWLSRKYEWMILAMKH